MDPLVAHLYGVFGERFRGSKPDIDPVLPNSDRVGGFVIWDGFDSLSQRERQREVWQAIRGNIAPADQQRITAILTLTPLEEQAILENE